MSGLNPLGAADRFEQHLIAGGELLRQGRVPEAVRELDAALELEPHSAKALALLGLAYFRGGHFAEARPVYERLVAATPADASHQLNLGLVHLKLGDAPSAITALEHSRDLDPSQGRAVNYLGLAYARAGRFVEAYQAFLIAGQSDLAREIADNLTADERATIEETIRRPSQPVIATPVPRSEPEGGRTAATWGPMIEPKPSTPSLPSLPSLIEPRRAVEVGRDVPPAEAPAPIARTRVEPVTITPRRAAEAMADLDQELDRAPALVHAPTPTELEIGESSESQRFVNELFQPYEAAAPAAAPVAEQRGAISRAVAQAAPAAAGAGLRVAAGSRPPQPLSEFATARLVRPEDGDHPFEISAGGVLIVRVTDKMFTRTNGVDVTGGRLTYEPAMRRSRGQSREEPFETGGRPMFGVSGHGHLIAAPAGGQFTAVSLDEDIFYLREDLVFAFEPGLRWENGHVPGSRNRIPMVQFRGTGAVAFRTERPLVAVKLAQDRVLYVDAAALAGSIGRVVPRAVTPVDSGPTSELFVECAGEGVVLVEEEQAPVRPSPT